MPGDNRQGWVAWACMEGIFPGTLDMKRPPAMPLTWPGGLAPRCSQRQEAGQRLWMARLGAHVCQLRALRRFLVLALTQCGHEEPRERRQCRQLSLCQCWRI